MSNLPDIIINFLLPWMFVIILVFACLFVVVGGVHAIIALWKGSL